jgi:hypothetical protein
VLQNQLFQEEERALVRHSLTHLHDSMPVTLRKRSLAGLALLVANYKFHYSGLL